MGIKGCTSSKEEVRIYRRGQDIEKKQMVVYHRLVTGEIFVRWEKQYINISNINGFYWLYL